MKPRRFAPLIRRWRAVVAALPDRRTGDNTQYAMADIGLSACAVLFTQCPSFLSVQRKLEQARDRNNVRSLFQVERIPTDHHIRQTLDPVEPRQRFRLFDALHPGFEQAGRLEAMRAVGHTRLIALDATWYFSSQSQTIHCPNCSCLRHADGQTTHFHSAITPGIVSPGHAQVVPLRPEFITPQDGSVKQDCEINAAKRWLAAHAKRHATGNDPVLGDDRYAHQPFCRQVLLPGFHFLFTCKPTSQAHLHSWVEALASGRARHTLNLRVKGPGNRGEAHPYRWANAVPLTDADDALKVNWCDVTVPAAAGAARYRNAFITDWAITADNVAGLVAAGEVKTAITQLKRREEFLQFMDQVVAESSPNQELHVILDNYCAHKKCDAWLARHPNVHFHFTPTSASWLNQVEMWFGILSRKALRGLSAKSTTELGQAIQEFVAAYAKHAKPFKWRKREVKGSQLRNTIVILCN